VYADKDTHFIKQSLDLVKCH